MIITRSGPPGSTVARTVTVRGKSVLLAVLVEVWVPADRRAELEARLAAGIARSFETSPGSLTARVRDALDAAHRWLPQQGQPAPAGGASVLVLGDGEALLAQVGPALAFGPGEADGAEPRRIPESSPWLKRGLTDLGPDTAWPPLGLGRSAVVHWTRWAAPAGSHVLLAASSTAGALPKEAVARLFAAGPERAAGVMDELLPEDPAALRIELPGKVAAAAVASGPAVPTPGSQIEVEPGPTVAAVAAASAAEGERAGPSRPALPPWRPWAARATRAGARVTVGLLPTRSGSGPDSYRVERARIAATAVVLLPLAVLSFALFQALRLGNLGGATPAGSNAGVDPLSGPTAPAADDPAARILRLTGAEPLASLPGSAADERVVVAPGGVPFVLNRALDQVDRVAGGIASPVLNRGQVVGTDTVGAPEDLFTVPGAGGAARVLALDAAGSLWDLSGEAVAKVPRAAQPAWQTVERAAGYGGNLYALDRAAGQIWRYIPAAPGAFTAPGTGWLADPTALADGVDLAIDGRIYVLAGDGTVRLFADGSPLPFQLAEVPEGLSGGQSLFASAGDGGLLVTDPVNGRILRFDPSGAYLAQVLLPPLATGDEAARAGRIRDLHDAWWDEAGGRLYLAAGSWLLGAPFAPGG